MWYEMYRAPQNEDKCIIRVFDDENNFIYVTETLGRKYKPFNETRYPFEKSNGEELHDADNTYFIQFLGTDSKTWMLTLYCVESYPERQLAISLSQPYGELPWIVKWDIRKAMRSIGMHANKFFATSCHDVTLRRGVKF